MGRWRDEGLRPLRFLIGGPDGLHPKILQTVQLSLSLGPLTYPHMLASVLILEQLYRASTLLEGVPYHR
ncbi:MAG: 23S rRNA (pseudouridine(1915)-N(3))-methyltransferase RlmH [Magnetococcales bacterium]|nr:23S rRNA (pseudouridine(1915)-N(3))-methyltransferase RlmH [Magnetococcales bacterium]